MSMNLHAKTKNDHIELWQTPTYISYMILVPPRYSVKGKKAKKALLRYIEWAKSRTTGKWDSIEDYLTTKQVTEDHIDYIKSFLNDDGLTVWVF